MARGGLVSKLAGSALLAGSCLVGGVMVSNYNVANAGESVAREGNIPDITVEDVSREFDWPWGGSRKAGLYSTFVGLKMGANDSLLGPSEWATAKLGRLKNFSTGDVETKKTRLRMKNDSGKEVDVELLGILHNQNAPLVAVIPGMSGYAGEVGNVLWMKWLGSQGCNVVSWDSTFGAPMVGKKLYGIPGNLEGEAAFGAKLVDGYIKANGLRPEKIGVVGRSYGAMQSLLIGRLSEQGKLPFRVDRVQAFCPPISMRDTMDVLDERHADAMRNNDNNNTLVMLALDYFQNLKIQRQIPETFDEKRAEWFLGRAFNYAVGDCFFRSLKSFPEVEGGIVINGKRLKEALVGEADEDGVRRIYTDAMNYNTFTDLMVVPYWEAKGISKETILDNGDVAKIMEGVPAGTDLILNYDDPINRLGAAEALERIKSPGRLYKVNRGGHCGSSVNRWTESHLKGIFQDYKEPERKPKKPEGRGGGNYRVPADAKGA